jgi:hypothetical protein
LGRSLRGNDEPARQRAKLVQAPLDGVRGGPVKDKMAELEARKRKPEAELGQCAPAPIRLHPNIGERYRKQVTDLNEPDRRTEVAELILALVDPLSFHRRRATRSGPPSISMAIWPESSAWFQKLAENRQ